MAMAARAAGLVLLLIATLPAAEAVRRGRQPSAPGTTPVKKVIELLKKLSAKVEEDGKTEAAQYDKYACFCKEEMDNKQYAMETSNKKIAELAALSSDLGADIAALNTGIGELATEISRLDSNITTATKDRQAEHDTYAAKEADTSNAIDALKRAIAALQDSKGEMSGKVKVHQDEGQEAEKAAMEVLAQLSTTAARAAQESLKKRAGQPGEAYEYEYHANDIIATLEGLLVTFTDIKKRLDLEEFEAKAMYEQETLGLSNEKKAAEKEKLEKEKMQAFKTEKKEKADANKAEEEADRDADKSFMTVLVASCEDKANEWDTRSQTRADELTAISKALEALETGVAPNWKANRLLVGLQKHQQAAPAFLQLRGSDRGARQQRKALALLRAAAERLHSPALSVAALHVQASEDHFVKVRQIIQDLVSRLQAQAQAEATTKGFCDKEMALAIALRDKKAEEVEDLEGQITTKEAHKAKLEGEIAELSEQIAKNMKALNEAAELRMDEKKDNQNVISDAKAGRSAVEYAITVLKQFYEAAVTPGPTLLQQSGAYVPPDSDRAGKTVGDLAPEIFENGYDGRQQASKGIIGMLEVILADFERTGDSVAGQERAAESGYEAFKAGIEADTQEKEKNKDTKEGQVSQIEDELVTLEDSKKDAKKRHDFALSELETLQSTCVAGTETYQERVGNREKEIEALKEAHDILENWQQ